MDTNLKPIAAGSAAMWNVMLYCVSCNAHTVYQNAVHTGWTYGSHVASGMTYTDYYCPSCSRTIS